MTENRARPLNGHAKPVRGRLPAYLKPETGLDPAKPLVVNLAGADLPGKGANVHCLLYSQRS